MKRNILLFSVLFILAAFLFKSCQKDEVEIYPANETAPSEINQDSLNVEQRNGQTYPIFYIQSASITYHQQFFQEAYNLDSIDRIYFIKSVPGKRTKVLGTLDRNYTNKPAALYNITIYLKNGTNLLFFDHWVKDTIDRFQVVPNTDNNLIEDAFKYRSFRNPSVAMRYYDTDYMVFKNKFIYTVDVDTIRYRDYIPANSRGTVFWLNHKM